MLQESHEQMKMLRAQLQDNEVKFDHVNAAKSNLEAKVSNLKLANDKNVQDLTMSQQEHEEAVHRQQEQRRDEVVVPNPQVQVGTTLHRAIG